MPPLSTACAETAICELPVKILKMLTGSS